MDITSGSSSTKNCTILLLNNNTINIMGGDVMDQLGLRLTMTKSDNKGEKNLYNISNIHQRISKWMFTNYPLGRSKNHVAKSTFKWFSTYKTQRKTNFTTTNRKKWKRTLKLLDEKQIKKLMKCSNEHFSSPVVIAVKFDQFIKIALDCKFLNDAIHKNKYQMQSLDHLWIKSQLKYQT